MSLKRLLLGLLGVITVAVVVYLVSPLFYDRVVHEDLPSSVAQENGSATVSGASSTGAFMVSSPEKMHASSSLSFVRAQGEFKGLAGHQARGTASRIQIDRREYVRFEENFEATNGPDLFVYLGKDGKIDFEKRLAPLKGNKGAQNYEISPDWKDDYNEVWIWCRAFSVQFAKAELRTK